MQLGFYYVELLVYDFCLRCLNIKVGSLLKKIALKVLQRGRLLRSSAPSFIWCFWTHFRSALLTGGARAWRTQACVEPISGRSATKEAKPRWAIQSILFWACWHHVFWRTLTRLILFGIGRNSVLLYILLFYGHLKFCIDYLFDYFRSLILFSLSWCFDILVRSSIHFSEKNKNDK